MELVCSGTRNRADHSAGCSPILRPRIDREYVEFLDRVDPKVPSKNAAGTGIGVVVDVDTVEKVGILLGTPAGNTQFASQAALRTVTSAYGRLRLDNRHTCAERGQIGPGSAIQWQLANFLAVYNIAQGGRG